MSNFFDLKTKITVLFFFIIVSFVPILTIFSNNIGTEFISFTEFLQSYLLIFIILLSINLIFYFFFKKDLRRSLITSSIIFLYFFQFRAIEKALSIFIDKFGMNNPDKLFWLSLICWIFGGIIISAIIKKFYNYKFQKIVVLFFTISFTFHIGLSVKNSSLFKNYKLNSVFQNNPLNTKVLEKKPNIYFIISDMFTGSEYLEILYDDNNKQFVDFFRKNEFVFKENHLSNYSNTFLSVASLFNTNYFKDEYFFKPKIFKLDSNFYENNNLVGNIFKYNDYETNYFICKFSYELKSKYCYKNDDLSSIPVLGNKFINGLFYHTFFDRYFSKIHQNLINKKILNINNFKDLFKFEKKNKQFNFLHIYLPHPPYILDSSCNFRKKVSHGELQNNNINLPNIVRKNGYRGNFDCAKKKILTLLNYLIKKDKNSIIIFLGDHGPHLIRKSKESSEYHNLLDKNSTFISLKYNKELSSCNNNFNMENLNHVNLFRIIFNCLGKNKNNLLENKIYFSDISNNNLKERIFFKDQIKYLKKDEAN